MIDRHHEHEAALAHITQVATEHRPSQVFVHHLDGRVQAVAILD